jgi:hypothetical protein
MPFFIRYLIAVVGTVESGERVSFNRGVWVENGCENLVGKTVKKPLTFPTIIFSTKTTHVFTHLIPLVFTNNSTVFTRLLHIKFLPN